MAFSCTGLATDWAPDAVAYASSGLLGETGRFGLLPQLLITATQSWNTLGRLQDPHDNH